MKNLIRTKTWWATTAAQAKVIILVAHHFKIQKNDYIQHLNMDTVVIKRLDIVSIYYLCKLFREDRKIHQIIFKKGNAFIIITAHLYLRFCPTVRYATLRLGKSRLFFYIRTSKIFLSLGCPSDLLKLRLKCS